MLDWGIEIVLALQALSGAWVVRAMELVSFLGTEDVYFLLMPLLYWCVDSRLGLRLALLFCLSLWLNSVLKVALAQPRPYWHDARVRLHGVAEDAFGMPSGHSQNAAVVWGTVALALRRPWAWVAAGFLIASTGLSRMILGVHFPTDVLAGWTLGLVSLWLFAVLERPVCARFGRLRRRWQVGAVLVVSLVLIAVGLLAAHASSSSFRMPDEWLQNYARVAPGSPMEPYWLGGSVTIGAMVAGIVIGDVFFRAGGALDATGPLAKRGLRYVVGIVGVFALWRGLGAVLSNVAEGDSPLGLVLRFIRFALVGAWISALAPWLFVGLGLARREPTLGSGDAPARG